MKQKLVKQQYFLLASLVIIFVTFVIINQIEKPNLLSTEFKRGELIPGNFNGSYRYKNLEKHEALNLENLFVSINSIENGEGVLKEICKDSEYITISKTRGCYISNEIERGGLHTNFHNYIFLYSGKQPLFISYTLTHPNCELIENELLNIQNKAKYKVEALESCKKAEKFDSLNFVKGIIESIELTN